MHLTKVPQPFAGARADAAAKGGICLRRVPSAVLLRRVPCHSKGLVPKCQKTGAYHQQRFQLALERVQQKPNHCPFFLQRPLILGAKCKPDRQRQRQADRTQEA